MNKTCLECKNSLDSSAFGWKDNGICNGCNAFKDSSGAGWEERFDKKFLLHSASSLDFQDADVLKDFIRAEKEKSKEEAESSAYERVVEVLAGMKEEFVALPVEDTLWGAAVRDSYLSALSEAILKIKELKGKI